MADIKVVLAKKLKSGESIEIPFPVVSFMLTKESARKSAEGKIASIAGVAGVEVECVTIELWDGRLALRARRKPR